MFVGSLLSEFDPARSEEAVVVWSQFNTSTGECLSIKYIMSSSAMRLGVLLTTSTNAVVYSVVTFSDRSDVNFELTVNRSYTLVLTADIYDRTFGTPDSGCYVNIQQINLTTKCVQGSLSDTSDILEYIAIGMIW